ncbi:hypothetical protein E1B28_006791 [Marasmius oreades]|uniref:Uncharacterized protein n=1 Tax=Marasmius oreades TaxID=181124 RepID=A0A9P8AAQ3_9AGAR|nr:uncharacterized protein E1B28_006791 [Marasmius oreades]KAG7096117.1 hypothetical protein E1B28_006791 [Marasmius oreades]
MPIGGTIINADKIRVPMSSLDGLNTDALNEIIQLVHASSRHTLFSLLRVNKTFHDLTLPFLYRVLDFDFTQADHRRCTEVLHDPYTYSQHRIHSITGGDPRILKAIRKVVVHSTYARWPRDTLQRTYFIPSDEDIECKWSFFVTFLSRIAHLQELVFDCQERVPLVLLDVLHSRHPLCRLHVRGWTRAGYDVRVGDPYEKALAMSPCLRSIDAFVFSGPPGADLYLPAFLRIASLAPNLQSMGYSISTSGGWRSALNRLTTEQREKIRTESERFEVKEPVRKGLRKIKWTELDENVLDRFEQAGLDLGTVESLDMGEVSRISGLIRARNQGLFAALKHLSFTVNHSSRSDCTEKELKSNIVDFLLSIPPLQSLSIANYSAFIDLFALLRWHGGSLRSLSLHEVEIPHENETREVLTVGQLKESTLNGVPIGGDRIGHQQDG